MMKFNIEFEVNESEAAALIHHLEVVVAQTGSPVLGKLLHEVYKDVNIATQLAHRFIQWVASYTSTNVSLESEFEYHLGFAPWWIAADNGLAQLCNLTLRDIGLAHGKDTFDPVRGKDLKEVKKVKDVIPIITDKYE